MSRILMKFLMIGVIFFVGLAIFTMIRIGGGGGALLQLIVVAGMIASIRAIWKYKPTTTNEVSLKKDDSA